MAVLNFHYISVFCIELLILFFWLGFLPSTFSMYAITLASAALLLERPAISVSVAAVGVLLGWPFSILTAVPLVIYALTAGNFKRVFWSGATTSICVMVRHLLRGFHC
jgi:alpha-1,2-mannosyltransferase